jgi:hypothetical protein
VGNFLRFGLPAIVVVGGFVYLLHAADGAAPARQETRIEIANALGD